MNKNYTVKRKSYILFLLLGLFVSTTYGQTLVHYWNFNNSTSISAITAPTQTIGGATLNAIPVGISVIDFANGTGQNFNLLNLNARNGDASGTHLRFNDPIGGALEFALPTTGYENCVVNFATRRSGSGAGTQIWSYSTDGSNYVFFANVIPNNGDPAFATLDFSSIAASDNNPNFKLKVEFEQGSGGTVGNNRFDNFTLEGTVFSGPDVIAPVATLSPLNNAINVATNVVPTISFNEAIRLIDNSAIDNNNVDAVVELRLNNASGAIVPFDATISGNVISITPLSSLAVNQTYYVALMENAIEDLNDNAITTVQSGVFTTANPSISFASNFITVNENQGTLSLVLNIINPASSLVDLVVKSAPFSTADNSDFTLTSQTIFISETSSTTQTITIPIIDDSLEEQHSEYFVLSLENASGISITGTPTATIYIVDNDSQAPVPSNQIELNYIGSFDPSGVSASTCEIVVHDPASQRLFTTSAVAGYLDIIDFSDPTSLSVINSININPYGGVTSVAVKNGVVAVASPNADETLNGSVLFFDTNGVFLNQVTVGALPDMITFSPDGTKVMTANEGQPNTDYSIDPEGSVSIIDISGGIPSLSQSNVTTLLFTDYNAQEAALIASGVRKIKATSTLSQDIEPEYITISSDSQKAWVSLQENNAIAEINLANNTISDVWAMGTKDISLPGNGFDVSDNNGQVLIANWPIQAYFIPDGIASYTVGGTTYLVTANEGDEKEYGAFTERVAVSAGAYGLDAANFPNASVLKQNYNLGRFRATNVNGNIDADAQFETIHCVGTRSFSIFNTTTKQIVFDSGDDFERYTAANLPALFNADHEDNTPKGRSRAKGPEPEGVTIAQIATETFAFVSLERVGGVMVYNITDPNNPVFVDYKNSRSSSAYSGDHGPEGITYVTPANSTTGKGYVLVANEISGTITIYEVDENTLSSSDFSVDPKTFVIFPNPASNSELVYFNRKADIELFDLTGKLILSEKDALTINISKLQTGVYIVKTSEGITKRLVVK
ncbi:choice-of-anchor I family protein [Flavobacterium channae]|uniref:choice-of-anchor I family protein n=1 Tax=Flavobacterium channae TaxID=2897181 RepID=UPI001E3F15BD|nr:choice-of-anchor I family protein [Flavobacterium channae]UGS23510.1 choice-of-anchor I family protein [Flavobacterium channae]